jgi:hypothetical protein
MGTFVTGTEVRYPVAWPSVPKPGSYTVRVVLNYGDGKTATYDHTMTVEAPQEAAPAPAAAGSQSVPAPDSRSSAANVAPGQAAGGGVVLVAIEPWMLYGFGLVLLVIVVLLALNLAVGRRRRKAE